MKKSVSIVLASVLSFAISGCGGSGDSNNPTPTNKSAIEGKAIDGYLKNAKACLDINNNSKCDTNEPSTMTNDNGSFSITTNLSDLSKYKVIVESIPGTTIDSDTPNTPITQLFVLKAPASDPKVVSPITTLVETTLELNSSLTKDDVVRKLKQDLNVSEAVDILGDYIKAKDIKSTDATNYEKVHKIAKIVTKSMAEAITKNENVVRKNYDIALKVIVDEIKAKLPEVVNEVEKESFNEDSYVLNVEVNSSKIDELANDNTENEQTDQLDNNGTTDITYIGLILSYDTLTKYMKGYVENNSSVPAVGTYYHIKAEVDANNNSNKRYTLEKIEIKSNGKIVWREYNNGDITSEKDRKEATYTINNGFMHILMEDGNELDIFVVDHAENGIIAEVNGPVDAFFTNVDDALKLYKYLQDN